MLLNNEDKEYIITQRVVYRSVYSKHQQCAKALKHHQTLLAAHQNPFRAMCHCVPEHEPQLAKISLSSAPKLKDLKGPSQLRSGRYCSQSAVGLQIWIAQTSKRGYLLHHVNANHGHIISCCYIILSFKSYSEFLIHFRICISLFQGGGSAA